MRREDFTVDKYELYIGEAALELIGKDARSSTPYPQVKDFYLTLDKRGKSCFSMILGGRMLEGEVLDAEGVEEFTAALREKLSGVKHIEIRRF